MNSFLCLLRFAASSFVYTYVNAIFKCTKSNGNDDASSFQSEWGRAGGSLLYLLFIICLGGSFHFVFVLE